MSASVFELQGSISMDSSGFEKAIREAIAEGKNLAKSLADNTAQMKALQDSVNKVKAQLDSAEKSMEETADATSAMAKEADKTADATGDLSKEVEGLKSDLSKAENAIEDTAKETKTLADRMDKTETETADLKKEVDNLKKEYQDADDETKKIDADTKNLGGTLDSVGEKFSNFASFVKNGFVTALKVGAGAVAAAGAAVAGYTKSAFDVYSQYEQLEGGVATLFGDSANTIMKNAEKAANTAGMSINEYLDTVMGFSSSLIQSTGRGEQTDLEELKKTLDEKYEAQKDYWDKAIKMADSAEKDLLRDQKKADLKRLKEANETAYKEAEAANMASTTTAESLERAAQLADVALRDMSDNANKFGTDMTSLQNAYQGFAKQNYTMLDNLKLGYGGTKEEMERLLSDAEKLTGKDYAISSYADIVEAIHAIQETMQIAGTTAEEAEGTLEGSTKAMAAAWQNLKLAIASGDAEKIEENITGLISGVTTVIQNSAPVIERILGGIGTAVQSLAPVISDKLPTLIQELLPTAVQAVSTLVSAVVGVIPNILSTLTDPTTINTVLIAVQDMLSAVITGLESLVEQAPDIVPRLLNQIGNALLNSINLLQKPLENIIYDLSDLIQESLPVLIPIVMELFKTLLTSVASLSSVLLPELADIFVTLFETLKDQDMASITLTLVNALSTIFEAVAESGEIIADNLLPIVTTLTELLLKGFEEHGEELQPAFTSLLVSLIKAAFYTVIDTAVLLIGSALTPLVNACIALFEGVFEPIGDKLSDGLVAVENWFKDLREKVGEKMGDIVTSVTAKITGLLTSAKSWGKDLIDNFVGGITDNISKVTNAVSGIANNVKDFIGFSEPDKGALADFHTFAPDMMHLFAQGIKDNASLVYDQINDLAKGISSDLEVETSNAAPAVSGNVGNSYVVNVSFDGATLSENTDLDNLSDTLIEKISEGLAQLDVFQTRAYGGVTI